MLFSMISMTAAWAEEKAGRTEAASMDWFVAGLLAIGFLWSLATISLSKVPATVTFAKTTAQTITGFLVGFLLGKHR